MYHSKQAYSLSFLRAVAFPVFIWILFTPWSGWLDLKVSRMFYKDGTFASSPFWDWLYIYGIWPAWLMIALATVGLLSSFSKPLSSWRRPCLFILLSFALGAGLIIHEGFKNHWGRPRPRQIKEFGGKQEFRPYYQPNFFKQIEPSKSFPCGHCTSGFMFFSLALLGVIYRSRPLFWLGSILAWGLGIFLGMTRIIQGGHFLSDVLASLLIMWITLWTLSCLLFKTKTPPVI